MKLVYIDESGNTGNNLKDRDQPLLTLCAMIVDESRWQSLETKLRDTVVQQFPYLVFEPSFEVHATDLRSGRGAFRKVAVDQRVTLRNAWMSLAVDHEVRLIHRSVQKEQFHIWLVKTLGAGVLIHPQVAAFAILSRSVDNYLAAQPGRPFGIFISDENKEIVSDIEKSIQVLRGTRGTLRLDRILEKGFFINSSKSLVLQLCDLFTLSLRKRDERQLGLTKPKQIDDGGIALAEKLLAAHDRHDLDVIKWLEETWSAQKKKRPGDKPEVG